MSLQSKSVKELKDMARGKVKGFSKMKKAELVAALGGGVKVVNLLPQQRGLKKGDKEKYLNAKKNIKKLNAVDIVKLGLPSGLENSLQHIRDKSKKPKKKIIKKVVAPAQPAAPKKPKKKIIKKVVAPAQPAAPKKPKKKIIKKVVAPAPAPAPAHRPRRRGTTGPPSQKAPPKSTVQHVSDEIRILGETSMSILPKIQLKVFIERLKKILDSDIPYNLEVLKSKFQKEIITAIKAIRAKKAKLRKTIQPGVMSKEEDELNELQNKQKLLFEMNDYLYDNFGKKTQQDRDSDLNYYVKATTLDPVKVKKTVTLINALKAVDDFADNKIYSKPTEEAKANNKKNMKILKDMAKEDLYGLKYNAIHFSHNSKSKFWDNAYQKLLLTPKAKFKLDTTLINFPYQTALARLKLRIKQG